MDLPYVYNTNVRYLPPTCSWLDVPLMRCRVWRSNFTGTISCSGLSEWDSRGTYTREQVVCSVLLANTEQCRMHTESLVTKRSHLQMIMLSGAKDSQKAYAVFKWKNCLDLLLTCYECRTHVEVNGRREGAMSTALINVLNKYPGQSYRALLNNIRNELDIIARGHGRFWQLPQLSCCHELGV